MVAAAALDILGLTGERFLEAAALSVGRGSGLAAEIYRRLFREGIFTPETHGLGAEAVAAFHANFRLTPLRVVRVAEEQTEAGITAKAVLATHDGYEIECVRIPMHGDDQTLCLSSQVGCRMGCGFCETARLGLIRNLTAAEIVAQVFTARFVLGWNPRNLVFMGMGEALDNADHLLTALHVLTDKRAFHFSQERLTICTVGHAQGIARLAALGWKRLNLSISLNSGDDATRSRLMPVNRKTPLAELQNILAAYPQRRNFTLGVNYCLMPGLNDAPEDLDRIAAFCAPLGRVLINLIPYNPGNAPLTRAPSEDEIIAFVEGLRERDLPVRRRITKGRSIMAACGQLGNAALRARKSSVVPAIASPSLAVS